MIVSVRIFLVVPETNGDRLIPVGGNESNLILKPFLRAQQWNDLLLQKMPELLDGVGSKLDSELARVHSLSRRAN